LKQAGGEEAEIVAAAKAWADNMEAMVFAVVDGDLGAFQRATLEAVAVDDRLLLACGRDVEGMRDAVNRLGH